MRGCLAALREQGPKRGILLLVDEVAPLLSVVGTLLDTFTSPAEELNVVCATADASAFLDIESASERPLVGVLLPSKW